MPPKWTVVRDPTEEDVRIEAMAARDAEGVAAERLKTRGVADMPVDRARAEFEVSTEQRVLRASRPANRRWRALDKLDQELDRVTRALEAARADLAHAEQQLADAPDADARSLAAWLEAGEKGQQPEATVYERERERNARKLLVDAREHELDRALERRADHITRNREAMLKDARRDVDEARERYLAKVAELPALRQQLVDARATVLWAATFPEVAESFGMPNAVALGLQEPVRRTLGTTALLPWTSLIDAFEADAAALADAFSRDQKKHGLGEPDPRTPLTEAMWDSDPETVAWKKAEFERGKQLVRQGEADETLLGIEIADQRPS